MALIEQYKCVDVKLLNYMKLWRYYDVKVLIDINMQRVLKYIRSYGKVKDTGKGIMIMDNGGTG